MEVWEPLARIAIPRASANVHAVTSMQGLVFSTHSPACAEAILVRESSCLLRPVPRIQPPEERSCLYRPHALPRPRTMAHWGPSNRPSGQPPHFTVACPTRLLPSILSSADPSSMFLRPQRLHCRCQHSAAQRCLYCPQPGGFPARPAAMQPRQQQQRQDSRDGSNRPRSNRPSVTNALCHQKTGSLTISPSL